MSSSPPLVSVICSFYNRAEYVHATLQGLFAQTYPNLEFIIIDDGSSDDTYEKLRRYDDPRLTVVRQDNTGLTEAYRRAIDLSKGVFIAPQDAGDVSLPTRTEKQVALLQARPEVGVVGCHVEEVNTFNGSSFTHRPDLAGRPRDLIRQRNPFTHGEVMFRRELYERVGGYRTFFRYAQDRDLWARMSLHAEFATVEEVLYERYLLPGGIGLDLDKLALQRYLSNFAVQCLESREKTGVDPVERYGKHAFFYREPSAVVAKELRRLSGLALLQKDIPLARRLNQQSLEEASTPPGLLLQGVIALIAKEQCAADAFFRLLFFARSVSRLFRKAKQWTPAQLRRVASVLSTSQPDG